MNSLPDQNQPERDESLTTGTEQQRSERTAESSRREIARRIALEALRADRHVLETSAATAFRDFSYVHPA
ncbi:hypothetical protein AB0A91_14760 [Streptomyces sp. NPDC042207]|uniref:hypothetical protein n=1 Tax=Streptomyces sp. NPDC042207 TaxID=3154331 RepID=UPI0033E8E261